MLSRAYRKLWKLRRLRAWQLSNVTFVFIIACSRSGSTLLQKIVGSNAGCHILGENNDVLGALLTAYDRALMAKATQGSEPRNDVGDPWYGIDSIDPQRFGRKLVELFIDEFLRPTAGVRMLGFKEIRYMDDIEGLDRILDRMRTLFGPSIFILNKRNSHDAAKSLSSKWDERPLDQIEAQVQSFNQRIERYADAHPNDSILVDYDKYLRDPDELRPLFERLALAFDREKIDQILRVRLQH